MISMTAIMNYVVVYRHNPHRAWVRGALLGDTSWLVYFMHPIFTGSCHPVFVMCLPCVLHCVGGCVLCGYKASIVRDLSSRLLYLLPAGLREVKLVHALQALQRPGFQSDMTLQPRAARGGRQGRGLCNLHCYPLLAWLILP